MAKRTSTIAVVACLACRCVGLAEEPGSRPIPARRPALPWESPLSAAGNAGSDGFVRTVDYREHPLVRRLRSESREERLAAIDDINRLSGSDRLAIANRIFRIDEKSIPEILKWSNRMQAIAKLQRLVIQRHLKSQPEFRRRIALRLMVWSGDTREDGRTLRALCSHATAIIAVEVAGNDEVSRRWNLAVLGERISRVTRARELAALFQIDDPVVKSAVVHQCYALGRWDAAALAILTAGAQSPFESVRETSLKPWSVRSAKVPRRPAGNTLPSTLQVALRGLDLSDSRQLQIAIAALGDPRASVRFVALDWLIRAKVSEAPIVRALGRMVDSRDWQLALAGVRGLEEIGVNSEAARKRLVQPVQHKDERVRLSALAALRRLGEPHPDAVSRLTALVKSHDLNVVTEAAAELGAYKETAAPAVKLLKVQLKSAYESGAGSPIDARQAGLRATAAVAIIETLGRIGKPAAPAVPLLADIAIGAKNPRIANAAFEAVRRIRGK